MNNKIVVISDSHGQHDGIDIPDGDWIIHAGDISRIGLETEVLNFLDWFSALPHKRKIFICGNHDWFFEKYPSIAIEILKQYPNIIYLENSGIELDGVKVWGSPVQPEFCQWAFNRQRGEEIKKYWDMIPNGTDILITHGPPYGILDKTIYGDLTGCEELLKRVKEISPCFHIFGHIHEAHGMEKISNTTFMNASVLNERYQLVNKPIIINIKSLCNIKEQSTK